MNLIIFYSQNPDAVLKQYFVASSIIRFFFFFYQTINFQGDLVLCTVKIDDESSDWLLTSKFEPKASTSPQK